MFKPDAEGRGFRKTCRLQMCVGSSVSILQRHSGTETLAKKKAESWRAERFPEKYILQKSQASMSEQWKLSWAFRVVGEARFWFSTNATVNSNIPVLICLFIILLTPLRSYFSRNGTNAITKLALSRRLMLWTLQGENLLYLEAFTLTAVPTQSKLAFICSFLMVAWWILLSSMLWSSFTLWTSLTFMCIIMFSGLWGDFSAFLLLPLTKFCTSVAALKRNRGVKGVKTKRRHGRVPRGCL